MKKRPLLKSISLGFLIILAIIIYAYGFSVTDVNFETTREEDRLVQLHRILRALANPNITDYDTESLFVEVPLYLPCPEGGPPPFEQDTSGPYLVVEPQCGDSEEILRVEGYNFWPDARGGVNFIPTSTAIRNLGVVRTDADGYFSANIQLPRRQPVAEAQTLQVEILRNVGKPYFSQTALSSWEKIIETVFLALLATTFGTMLAIPTSFFAARNLMTEEKKPLTAAALSLLGWPAGIFFGINIAEQISLFTNNYFSNLNSILIGLLSTSFLAWFILRKSIPPIELEAPKTSTRIFRLIGLIVSVVFGMMLIFFIVNLALSIGDILKINEGVLGFLGNFIFQLGDLLKITAPVMISLGFGAFLGNWGGRIGGSIADKSSTPIVKIINAVLAAIALALLFAILGAGINWLYQIDNLNKTLWWPAGIGATIGIIMAGLYPVRRPLPTGGVVYYITRILLNGVRSVEPLVMVIIFVVWVSIGPFAGALALTLHTIAALAKLYSEQVESILPGPLEAIKATGANKIQTIIYGVIPQIIPPYISFTMYRWDINVRFSTIIGFAGGGGIGFLLSQNIALLHYRDASVQMLAIAIVVASMDYISSIIRENVV